MNPAIHEPTRPHLSVSTRRLSAARYGPAGRFGANRRPFEDQVADSTIITGTPKTVLPKIRQVLEYLRPGSVFFWDGDGAMTHDDQMRSLRLIGEEVIPAVKEMGKELELYSPFEVDPRHQPADRGRLNPRLSPCAQQAFGGDSVSPSLL